MSADFPLLPEIRNAARALIIRDRHILLLRKAGGGRGERFALPGGGQEVHETLEQTLQRECHEEIGTTVRVVGLLHVADFWKSRASEPPSRRHGVDFLFRCEVAEDYQPVNGPRPDKHQLEVVWKTLAEAARLALFPAYLGVCVANLDKAGTEQKGEQQGGAPVYLGSFADHATT